LPLAPRGEPAAFCLAKRSRRGGALPLVARRCGVSIWVSAIRTPHLVPARRGGADRLPHRRCSPAPERGRHKPCVSPVTLGRPATIGRFDAPGGAVSVVCAGPSDDYVVTPGGTGILKSVLGIIGGAFVGLGGILLFIFGLIGRRVPA
jgi:hypothetical protein